MSREIIGGNDPLGINPQAQVEQIRQTASQKAIEAYRAGLLLPSVSVADATRPAVVSGIVGDDGKAITLEERQRIAAARKPFDPKRAFESRSPVGDDQGYDKDLEGRKVEPIGESAQKVIDANPDFRIAPVRNELEITPSSQTTTKTIPDGESQ